MNFFAQNKLNTAIILGTLISCFIAFYNKFPLVYPDTGTYIGAGYSKIVPPDRPIFYSFFIYYLSMNLTVWPIIFAQGFLVSYMNYLTLGMFFDGLKRKSIFLLLTTLLVIFTGFSYNVSILIPDIFSALVILCLVNILLNKRMTKVQTIFVYLLFLFSICTQFSSVSIVTLVFASLMFNVIYLKWKKTESTIKIKHLAIAIGLFLSCLIMMPLMNYALNRKFVLSESNHVFLMNRLVETGILEDYLLKACNTHNYKICEYKNGVGWDFIWSPESALQKTGGWEANREEYNEIIRDIFSKKRYIGMFAIKSFENSFKQFFAFNVTVYPPMLAGTAPFEQIEWHYKHVYREYFSSLQSNAKLDLKFVNQSQQIIVILSMLILFAVALTPAFYNKLAKELKWTIILFLLHNIINAIICANLSTIDDRYQNRLVWLYPFFASIVVISLMENRNKETEEKALEKA